MEIWGFAIGFVYGTIWMGQKYGMQFSRFEAGNEARHIWDKTLSEVRARHE